MMSMPSLQKNRRTILPVGSEVTSRDSRVFVGEGTVIEAIGAVVAMLCADKYCARRNKTEKTTGYSGPGHGE